MMIKLLQNIIREQTKKDNKTYVLFVFNLNIFYVFLFHLSFFFDLDQEEKIAMTDMFPYYHVYVFCFAYDSKFAIFHFYFSIVHK